jgi:hypothetical protein
MNSAVSTLHLRACDGKGGDHDRHHNFDHHHVDCCWRHLLGHHSAFAFDPIAGAVCQDHPRFAGSAAGHRRLVGHPAITRRSRRRSRADLAMRREYFWALITLTVAIALAFILLTVAKDDNNSQGASQLPTLPPCLDSKTRDTIERLTDRAVDQGYQRHVSHLFDVLMGNPNTEQFNRARVGMQNGIKGYLLAQEHINSWTPPVCK